jgi:hypothetical protein
LVRTTETYWHPHHHIILVLAAPSFFTLSRVKESPENL